MAENCSECTNCTILFLRRPLQEGGGWGFRSFLTTRRALCRRAPLRDVSGAFGAATSIGKGKHGAPRSTTRVSAPVEALAWNVGPSASTWLNPW